MSAPWRLTAGGAPIAQFCTHLEGLRRAPAIAPNGGSACWPRLWRRRARWSVCWTAPHRGDWIERRDASTS